jgi:hypothetical protein
VSEYTSPVAGTLGGTSTSPVTTISLGRRGLGWRSGDHPTLRKIHSAGIDIFADRVCRSAAKNRVVTIDDVVARERDLIIGSRCGGKKFRPVPARAGEWRGLASIEFLRCARAPQPGWSRA